MASALCGPCVENKKDTTADQWCLECNEAFCTTCADSHRGMKMSKNHQTVNVNEVQKHVMALFQITCSDHDESQFDFFCRGHDSLCCRECLLTSHRTCESIMPLNTASENARQSQEFTECNEQVNDLSESLQTLLSQKEARVINIEDESEAICEEIRSYKRELLENIEIKVKAKLDELHQLKSQQVNKVNQDIAEIEEMAASIKERKKEFLFVRDRGSNQRAFLLVHTVRKDLAKIQAKLLQLGNSPETSLKFCRNILSNPSEQIGSFQSVSIESQTVTFAQRHLNRSQVYVHNPSFVFHCESNLKEKIKGGFDVTGMVVSEDNTLLLCDFQNKRIIVCDQNGNFQTTIKTKYKPWDIAIIPGTQRAVSSTRDEGIIQFIDLKSNMTLFEKQVMKTRGGGIAVNSSHIVLAGEGKILYLNHNGDLIETTDIKAESAIWYLSLCSGNQFCYSESTNAEVHFVNPAVGTTSHYNSDQLKTPMKIATDQKENIYIVGRSSHNIHRLSPDGKFSAIILDDKNEIDHPNAICFNSNYTKLFVSNKKGTTISVFIVNGSFAESSLYERIPNSSRVSVPT